MRRFASALLSALLFIRLLPAGLCIEPAHSASSAVLMEASTGRVLYEYHSQDKREIASITKLMTALVAVEQHPCLSDRVIIRREWTGAEGSSVYLKPGEELSLEELLYGLLLASGNDAAAAVAGYCAGSIEQFVCWMNEKAAELGMNHTHFVNPSGLSDEAQYSTAYDVALLGRAVLGNRYLLQVTASKNKIAAGRCFTNHNKLLWRYPGCVGLKTGYTLRAGRTLVSAAKRNGMSLVAVTLNDRDDWNDHETLLNYGFAQFQMYAPVLKGGYFGLIPAVGGSAPMVPVVYARTFSFPLGAGENLEQHAVWNGPVQAPLSAGAEVGTVYFSLDGEPIGAVSLLLKKDLQDLRRDVSARRWKK